MTDNNGRLGSSFRDPSGFLFSRDGVLFRQINVIYREHYEKLMESGLYDALVNDALLIPHKDVTIDFSESSSVFKIIQPQQLQFVAYPYEWSFSQFKDAALVTLAIQKRALEFGMSLKDSSAYNIQFHRGKPILIDTLSFETYTEGKPWVAYRQFCQHFLAPLALMAYKDVRLSQLIRVYIDGIPLDLASRMLPFRTRFVASLFLHIHLHASAQRHYADKVVDKNTTTRQMSLSSMLGLLDSLKTGVRKLHWQPKGTEWADYYATADHYSSESVEHKKHVVNEYLDHIQPRIVWDLGANEGMFSRLSSVRGIPTLAFDIDPGAVEKNYLDCVTHGETHLLPLVLDLTNPSPSLGWSNRERMSLLERAPADAILALALIHHLAISNNVPLHLLAKFFHNLGNWLIIEFVPKTDPQVELLLATREDIFSEYDVETFERIFSNWFNIVETISIRGTQRCLYLMKKR